MNRLWLASATVLLALEICGCAQNRGPGWFTRSTAQDQQRRAQKFDPYPQTNSGGMTNYGGPSMAGSRPREYDQPYAPTQRDYFDRVNPQWGMEGRPQDPGR